MAIRLVGRQFFGEARIGPNLADIICETTMKLSVILTTRNRSRLLDHCLDSIATSLNKASLLDAEIVIVNNASTDDTGDVINAWASRNSVAVTHLTEPLAGKGHAVNRALVAARGELLAFTDDDCRLDPDFVSDLLRHASQDREPTVRGGRTELGDLTDLPLTINTSVKRMQWSRRENSARGQSISGQINGCNMVIPRVVIDKVGPFDERFGPGSFMYGGEDDDFLIRAYLANFALEYVPDMVVFHFHGRKTPEQGRKLMREYLISNGGDLVKHGFRHLNFFRPFYWDCKGAVREILAGGTSTTGLPYFSHRDKVAFTIYGALRYLLIGQHFGARTVWNQERSRIAGEPR